jgi:hypothetical protein
MVWLVSSPPVTIIPLLTTTYDKGIPVKLEPLMEYYANLEAPLEVGVGSFGNRMIVEVNGGEFEGPRLKGKIRELSAADWLIVDNDGVGHLDVRATFETHDGALIYVQYFGNIVLNEVLMPALAGTGDCDYGDTEFFIAPRMETGDERYTWLNKVVAVAQGRIMKGRVEYKVFQCVN